MTEPEEGASDPTCVFCAIVHGERAARVVGKNAHALAFYDLNPVAPSHVLIVPRRHIEHFGDLREHHGEILVAMVALTQEVARHEGLEARGYRVVANVGADAGNSVPHLHLHLLGGRRLAWPPG